MSFEKKTDVVVAGGGIAGVAAAVSAAKYGAKVIIIEKNAWLGGLATCGLINVYEPLCDGNGRQVTFGMAEKMLKISMKYGPGNIPQNWQHVKNASRCERLHCTFSPASMVLALDEMLENTGVEIWLDTIITGTGTGNGKLDFVTVANKSGTGRISAKVFIDASGDADLAFMSGDDVHIGTNRLASWAVEYFEGTEKNKLAGNIHTLMLGNSNDNNNALTKKTGINGRLVSEFLLKGRKCYREILQNDYDAGIHDRFSRYPLLVPITADLRTTRCFKGKFALDSGMEWTRFEDSIGLAADWRKPGFVWEIPYRTLFSAKFSNLLAAGRCTASRNDAWEITRVIPVAAMTGEVSGITAAIAVDSGVVPDALQYSEISRVLTTENDYVLHFDTLGLQYEKN